MNHTAISCFRKYNIEQMRANSKRNDDFDFGLDEDIDGGR